MPLNRSHLKKLDLRVTIPGVSPWNSALNVEKHKHRRPSILSNGYLYDVTLNDHEARAVTGENAECFDELDLVSECSSPCNYTPGKYLQLCDIEPTDAMDDVTLFPVSFQSSAVDMEEVSLLGKKRHPSLDVPNFRQMTQGSISRSRIFPFVSNKTLVVVALCMVVAFTALGCLATVI